MTLARAKEKPPPPLDRGWSWMIVLGVFNCVFFMVGIAKSYGLFLLAFQKHFGVSMAYAAMPISLTAFVYAFAAPCSIIVAEFITPQKVVIIGAVVGLVGIALCSLLISMAYIVVVYGICVGIGNSCFYGNGLVMIGKYFRTRRSIATGLGLAGASIGQFVMPPIIEYLLETYGLSGTLLIIAALFSHCAVSGALFRPIEQYGPAAVPVKVVEDERDKVDKTEEDKVALVTSSPEHSESQGDAKTPDISADTSGPGNGYATLTEIPSLENSAESLDHSKERNSAKKERKCVVSFVETNSSNTRGPSADKTGIDSDNQIRNEYPDDDDKRFLERKALLASTGSVFLVSPSTLDVSDVDSKAHGLNVIEGKQPTSYLRRIFDFSVLKSYITIFFIIVSFLCFFGYFNFILFLPAITRDKGITKYDNALLISICGAGDLIARIGSGFVADRNLIPRYQLKAIACIVSGINIFIFIFANTFAWLAFHCFCYGFLGGVYVCLMSVVLIDFVGLQLMAKNLAIVLLFQGIGAAVGQIFLGWIKDQTGTFSYMILILSLNMICGGLLLFCYRFVRRWEDARLASDTDKSSDLKI
ncbi:hypothetical protein BsWGS_03397 [Bradybaena similaris]